MAAKKSNTEEIRFEIGQLRQEKLIFAAEAVAVSVLGLIFLFALAGGILPVIFGDLFQNPDFGVRMIWIILGVPSLFSLYAFVATVMKCRKIKELEKSL